MVAVCLVMYVAKGVQIYRDESERSGDSLSLFRTKPSPPFAACKEINKDRERFGVRFLHDGKLALLALESASLSEPKASGKRFRPRPARLGIGCVARFKGPHLDEDHQAS